jgi:RNA polymerase sigma factor (sigma-70 family)
MAPERSAFDFLSLFECDDPQRADQALQCLRARLVLYLERRGCYEAEDLVSEAIIILMKKAAAGERFRSLEAFSIGVAHNVWRGWRKRQRPTTDDIPPTGGLSDSMSRTIAAECIALLSPDERELLEWFFIDDASAKTIGEALGISDTAVRGRVFKLVRRVESHWRKLMALPDLPRGQPASH